MPYRNNEIKSGMIIMWSGLLSDVPDGWSICDGTNGTPDLRNKFVRGSSGEVGCEGGNASHCHALCNYMGCIYGCCAYVMVNNGSTYAVTTLNHVHSMYLSSYSSSNLPPYYELIFIRKD